MTETTDTPEFPKALVRLVRSEGGWAAEIREVADGEGEAAAVAEGFVVAPPPPGMNLRYPKWVYHADGRRQVVASEEAREKLGDGWEDGPIEPEPKAEGEIPIPVPVQIVPTPVRSAADPVVPESYAPVAPTTGGTGGTAPQP